MNFLLRASYRSASRHVLAPRQLRSMSTAAADLRTLLQSEVKAAMKSKDKVSLTTLRAVLSEVNNVDKEKGAPVPSSTISEIIRKSVQRRNEASTTFKAANRMDLAEKEDQEAEILSKLLPPLLTPEQIDAHLQELRSAVPADPKRAQGVLFKEFYSKVDKSSVDPNVLKERIQNFLATLS